MSLLSKIFKPITKNLQKFERIMNSAQTPEEFILAKRMSPSIAKIKTFLSNYSIHQTFKAKVYNSETKLYLQNTFISIVLEINVSQINEELWNKILILQYPEHTTMSFLYLNSKNIYLTITTRDFEKKRHSYKVHKQMSRISKHIIDILTNNLVEANSVEPNQLLKIYNKLLSQPQDVEYDSKSYIYNQIPKVNNDICHDGSLLFNDVRNYVIYTKQYPNIIEDKFGIFDRINQQNKKNYEYTYSINIELSDKYDTDQVLKFNTTFILKQFDVTKNEKEFTDLLRHYVEWFTFPNLNFPLQQLLNCIPLQYDHEIARQQSNYSTNQKLPLKRVSQLIPSFGENNEKY